MSDLAKESSLPTTHRIRLKLATGATLRLLLFSEDEHRWIHEYLYEEEDPETRRVLLRNDVKLVANYDRGVLAPEVALSMHVVFPGRLGQEFFAGADISPGAKTYFEFTYRREDDEVFRLVKGQIGARPAQRFGDEPGLAKVPEIPFPVPAIVEAPYRTTFLFPFKKSDWEIAHFEVPIRTCDWNPEKHQ